MDKSQLLDTMASVVEEVMTSFKSDFYEHDFDAISKPDFKFPFIWIVGESHTHLLLLGGYRDAFFGGEATRYAYVREHNPYQYYLNNNYFADDRWYLVTEDGLRLIDRNQAKAAIMDYVTPAVNAWIEENGPLSKNEKLKVKLEGISISELKELVAECRVHGNDSLMDCLKRFHSYTRSASDQYIEMCYFPPYKEFNFCEYTNGRIGLVGGIIFHGWPETGYKENGSVQLSPCYGWPIHT